MRAPRSAALGVLSVLSGLTLVASVAGCGRADPADLILHNARVYTVNNASPTASAIAIRADRIALVGDDRAALRLRGDETRVVDARGMTIVPGLHDAHGHVTGLGERLQILDLRDTTSYDQVVERVRERARSVSSGEWILGRGWDQNDWPAQEWPSHGALSAVSPDHPVYLTRIDGHAGLANARAMAIAGVTRATPDPAGGRILRDASGAPLGVFVDNAEDLITAHIPATSAAGRDERIRLADEEMRRLGLTMVHDAGASQDTIEAYRRLADAGAIRTRLYVMRSGSSLRELMPLLEQGPIADDTHRLVVRAVKIYADGALGSRGAALLEPYADEPGTMGLPRMRSEEMYAMVAAATRAGYQPAVHAIGDGGNRMVLDVFERVQREIPGSRGLRMRLEHAQILDARDIPRFADLNVIASMQPTHATSDMPWVPARLGTARMEEGAYVWRRLLDAGATIAAGSDFPVEEANPMLGFYAAVTRQDLSGNPPGGWMPRERLTREQALRAFTLDAAYAAHAEQLLGSLEEGKLADFVMLSRDIMAIPPEQIPATEVMMTVVGGEIVFEREPERLAPR